ncbi:hypothetical protein FACS189472_18520 [Alphaproteobacteria bacterium]|nr:hypothetical protein FACS189472_18520 [Alphaproteobacteria bacterium]
MSMSTCVCAYICMCVRVYVCVHLMKATDGRKKKRLENATEVTQMHSCT